MNEMNKFRKIFCSLFFFANSFKLFLCVQNSTNQPNGETELLKVLFSDYDKRARPVASPNETALVKIAFRMIQLKEVNTREQYINLVGWIATYWNDYRFSWNPDEYNGLTSVAVPPSELWLPTYILSNSGSPAFYEDTWYQYLKAIIYHTGNVVWSPVGQFKAGCNIDVTYFPYDEQTCTYVFENWIYRSSEVNLTYTDESAETFDRSNEHHNEFSILSVEVTREDSAYLPTGNVSFAKVFYTLHLKRKPLYYIYSIVVQNLFLCFMILTSFKLPAESGERMSMGITLFLALAVLLLYIVDQIPNSSQSIPIINVYILSVLTMSVVSVCETVLILYMHNHKPTPPPAWLVNLNEKLFMRILCRRRAHEKDVTSQEPGAHKNGAFQGALANDSQQTNGSEANNVDNQMYSVVGYRERPHTLMQYSGGENYARQSLYIKDEDIQKELDHVYTWRCISRNIDRITFWTFFVIMILVIFILLVIVPYGH